MTASKWPRCSLWWPRRPPRIGRCSAGASSCASASTAPIAERYSSSNSRGSGAIPASIAACRPRRPRTARERSASSSRGPRPCAARSPRCRRRDGSSIAGEVAMVGDFLHRLVRELAQELVARLSQPLQKHVLPGRVEQVPGDRLGEVAVGLLDQQAVAESRARRDGRRAGRRRPPRRAAESPARSGRARGWRG